MPLARTPEMAELALAIFDTELEKKSGARKKAPEKSGVRQAHRSPPVVQSSYAYLAANSRVLQATEPTGNAQLMWDDAIYYDQGMRMVRLTFDKEGQQLLPDASVAERENIRRHNWLVREGQTTTWKTELAAV